MPSCRNCHSRLTRFDKDVCPVCGCKDPFLGVSMETNEITQEIDSLKDENVMYRPKKRGVAVFLTLLAGFFGVSFFYLKYIMTGILYSIACLICAGILFVILFFLTDIGLLLDIIIPVIVLYVSNIILGIFIGFNKNFKDGRGEFLR